MKPIKPEVMKTLREKVNENMLNKGCDFEFRDGKFMFSDKQYLFEQYKLLVESSHKTEERRGSSASIYLTINTLLASSLVGLAAGSSQFKILHTVISPILIFLILVGIITSYNWLMVMVTYKNQNLLNHYFIQALEKFFPARIFSLKVELEAKQIEDDTIKKANTILLRENIMPIMFMITYSTLLIYGIFIGTVQ